MKINNKIIRIILGTVLVPLIGDLCILWYFTGNLLFLFNHFGIFLLSLLVAFACVGIFSFIVRLWIEQTQQSFIARLAIALIFGLLLACLLISLMPVGVWLASALIATVGSELLVYAHWRMFGE